MTGDFRQTLPVIPRGTKVDEIMASIKASQLWKDVKVFELKTNVRAERSGDPDSGEYSKVLDKMGKGVLTKTGIIKVPEHVYVKNKAELFDHVYKDLKTKYNESGFLEKRCILAPKNAQVDQLNEELLKEIPGDTKTYSSRDSTVKKTDATKYPSEVLNALSFPGIPPHNLVLKRGSPVILLRNLDPPMLVNGTRLTITNLGEHKIEAKILVGKYKGETVFLPRIPFIPKVANSLIAKTNIDRKPLYLRNE